MVRFCRFFRFQKEALLIRYACLPYVFALASCGNPDSQVLEAVKAVLSNTDGARFGKIAYGDAEGVAYACVTVDAKNPLGTYSGKMQLPAIKVRDGQWASPGDVVGTTSESCLKKLADDFSGRNDSIPPSEYPTKAAAGSKEAASSFDRREVRWFESFGDNVIQGEARLSTKAGEIRTCGSESDTVTLVPVSKYGRERMIITFGNDESGFRSRPSELAIADPLYLKTVKETGCDDAGRFLFENLPDGDYFIISSVTWTVYTASEKAPTQGGNLMKRVRVRGGEVAKVLLVAP